MNNYITVEFSNEGIFGDSGLSGINESASRDEFVTQLELRLREEYPGHELTITPSINDNHSVNGNTSSHESMALGEIIHDVWESWDWIVHHG